MTVLKQEDKGTAEFSSSSQRSTVFDLRTGGSRSRWQGVAIFVCAVLALLMIVNTQMSGEAMWFWYGMTMKSGAKLYSQLHTALQPLFVLEMSTWLRLFGPNLITYEVPSFLHALLLAFAIYLVLRESAWPDYQKALVLLGAYVLIVGGHSYRFDDYHVIAEFLIMFALWLLLRLGSPLWVDSLKHTVRQTALLGLLCGLTWTTRVTDGAALTAVTLICIPFLLTRRRLLGLAAFAVAALITVVVTVLLTRDSFPAYLANSIFRAAASKGGTHSIFLAPFAVIGNTVQLLMFQKRIPVYVGSLFVLAYLINRYRPALNRFIIPIQFAFVGVALLMTSPVNRIDLKRGLFYEDVVLFLILALYLAAGVVLFRFVRHLQGRGTWDRREIVVLLPVFEWASYSAGAAAEPLTNYYEPIAILLVLLFLLKPRREGRNWFHESIVTVMALIAVSGIVTKVLIPYSWQNYKYDNMFANREWYHHPVYGAMYIDRDLLHFSQKLCSDIGAVPGKTAPDLLSLPYPYPNYFCATRPWHEYVQTFFDTASRTSMEKLIHELQTAPPTWIVYQRQMNIMDGSERLYNHGAPIPQRYLDALIAEKLAKGEWKLVDYSSYLRPKDPILWNGTGWYVIRTTK